MKIPEFVDCPLCGVACHPGELKSVKDGVTIMTRDRCRACIEDTGCVETTGVDEEEAEILDSVFSFGGKLG